MLRIRYNLKPIGTESAVPFHYDLYFIITRRLAEMSHDQESQEFVGIAMHCAYTATWLPYLIIYLMSVRYVSKILNVIYKNSAYYI